MGGQHGEMDGPGSRRAEKIRLPHLSIDGCKLVIVSPELQTKTLQSTDRLLMLIEAVLVADMVVISSLNVLHRHHVFDRRQEHLYHDLDNGID